MGNIVLSRSMQLKIKNEVRTKERIIWSDKPRPTSLARRGIPLAIFGIPWTAFSVFWVFAASGFSFPSFSKGWDFFPLFGIPFVLIGFGLLSAPLWMGLRANKTAYVLTDKRAIIFRKSHGKYIVKDYLPHQLQDVYREENDGGSGDVIFFEENKSNDDNTLTKAVGFLGIDDVKAVEDLVKDLASTDIKD